MTGEVKMCCHAKEHSYSKLLLCVQVVNMTQN